MNLTEGQKANKRIAQDRIYEYNGEEIFPCRSCEEPIFLVPSSKNKKMPVNYKTRKSHFIDCPEAKRWRKKKIK